MKERPIIFSPEMSRAIREGRKTETRRVITERHGTDGTLLYPPDPKYDLQLVEGDSEGDYWIGCNVEGTTVFVRCPYGDPGDRLWVRESFRVVDFWAAYGEWTARFEYRAGGCSEKRFSMDKGPNEPVGWRLSIHMPRWACRTVLEVVERFPQRLQEIDEASAIAEGFHMPSQSFGMVPHPIDSFAELWDRINAKRGYPWDSNPWVWVIRFRVVDRA